MGELAGQAKGENKMETYNKYKNETQDEFLRRFFKNNKEWLIAYDKYKKEEEEK